jgi:hypothetical protein
VIKFFVICFCFQFSSGLSHSPFLNNGFHHVALYEHELGRKQFVGIFFENILTDLYNILQ